MFLGPIRLYSAHGLRFAKTSAGSAFFSTSLDVSKGGGPRPAPASTVLSEGDGNRFFGSRLAPDHPDARRLPDGSARYFFILFDGVPGCQRLPSAASAAEIMGTGFPRAGSRTPTKPAGGNFFNSKLARGAPVFRHARCSGFLVSAQTGGGPTPPRFGFFSERLSRPSAAQRRSGFSRLNRAHHGSSHSFVKGQRSRPDSASGVDLSWILSRWPPRPRISEILRPEQQQT